MTTGLVLKWADHGTGEDMAVAENQLYAVCVGEGGTFKRYQTFTDLDSARKTAKSISQKGHITVVQPDAYVSAKPKIEAVLHAYKGGAPYDLKEAVDRGNKELAKKNRAVVHAKTKKLGEKQKLNAARFTRNIILSGLIIVLFLVIAMFVLGRGF